MISPRTLDEESSLPYDLFYNEETGDVISAPVPWGQIIGASMLVQLVTLAGIFVFAVVFFHRRVVVGDAGSSTNAMLKLGSFWTECLIPSFAAGALLATVVFLLIPESLHLLAGGHDDHAGHDHRMLQDDEVAVTWKFGVALLCGFLSPFVLSFFYPHVDEAALSSALENQTGDGDEEDGVQDEEAEEKETVKDATSSSSASTSQSSIRNGALASSILLGDFLHNFGDGIFIGTAFLLCNSSLGWTVTFATIYHEIAQEIADFTVLVTLCNFSVLGALTVNFLSGFSVVIGALLVAWFNFSNPTIGFILTVSAGVYVYIAAVECLPRIKANKVWALVAFTTGAVPIGLVLLNHQHC